MNSRLKNSNPKLVALLTGMPAFSVVLSHQVLWVFLLLNSLVMNFFFPFFLELDLIVPSLVEIKLHEEIANCDLHGCCIHAFSLREKQYEGFELVCHYYYIRFAQLQEIDVADVAPAIHVGMASSPASAVLLLLFN